MAAVFVCQRATPFKAFAAWLITVPAEFFAGFGTDGCAILVKVKGIFIYIITKIAFIQVDEWDDIFLQAVTADGVRIAGGIQKEPCGKIGRAHV